MKKAATKRCLNLAFLDIEPTNQQDSKFEVVSKASLLTDRC